MRTILGLLIAGLPLLWFTGCGEQQNDDNGATATTEPTADSGAEPGEASKSTEPDSSGSPTATGSNTDLTPIPIEDGIARLSAENSQIVFVGTHADPNKPDPRTGGFGSFDGEAKVADGKLSAVSVKIDVDSVFTFSDKLTGHLKNADFFEINEFPTAEFTSTKIADGTITGNLTLHGVTNEIVFPAQIEVSERGITLRADFQIDRTAFGMTYGEGKILPGVDMSLTLGAPTDQEAIINSGASQ